MPAPKIEIDYAKCTNPMLCKKCLQVCPTAVFEIQTLKMERMRETDPRDPEAFRLDVFYRDRCTACNDCVTVCPVEAITIVVPDTIKS